MVTIKHKVTIKTKTAQEETPAAVEGSSVTLKRKQPDNSTKVNPTPEPPKKSNTGKIVGGIAAAAALFAGVYFFGLKDSNKSDDGGTPQQTEQLANAGDAAKPDATKKDVPENGNAGDNSAVSNSPETSTPTDGETPGASDGENAPASVKSEDTQSANQASNASSATKPVQKAQSPKQIEAAATNIAASSAPIGSDVVENAKRVIRGDFGNGQERKDKLGAAYSEIQRKVNEMYRQGHVY